MDGAKLLTWDTTISYDFNDNPTSTNQGGQMRSFKYDSLSRLTFERTPEQSSTIDDGAGTLWSAKYTYKDFGAIATREDARRVKTTYNYDTLNRLLSVAYDVSITNPPVVATPGVTISYGTAAPELGQVKTITDGAGTETFGYDGLSRTQSRTRTISGRSYTITYAFNQIGQLKRMTYPSLRQVDVGYDARARLATIGGTRNYINSISYKPSQQVQSIQLANGLTESYGYSADRLQLTSQSVQQGQNQPLMNIGYNYNADQTSGGGTKAGNSGQLISMTAAINNFGTDNNRDQTFKYDQVGRLTYASGSQETGAWQRRYTYDRWGNRKKVETFSSGAWCTKQIVDFKYAANGSPSSNRPTSVEDYVNCNPSFTSPPAFDAAGNTTSFGTPHGVPTHFSDGESRLVEVRNVSGQSLGQYTYDAANRRVKKVTAAGLFTMYGKAVGSSPSTMGLPERC
jgi:YD repeat-containing protein